MTDTLTVYTLPGNYADRYHLLRRGQSSWSYCGRQLDRASCQTVEAENVHLCRRCAALAKKWEAQP